MVLDEGHIANVRPETHAIPRYHASVEVWTPAPNGASYINHLSCAHDHTTPEAAVTCGATLARTELRNYA